VTRLLCWLLTGHVYRRVIMLDALHIVGRECACGARQRMVGGRWFEATADWGFRP
jgi:hypothetical protein